MREAGSIMSDPRNSPASETASEETFPATITLGSTADLTPAVYDAVIRDGARIEVAPAALEHVARYRQRFLRHLETGVVCYGVTTGLGALAKQDLDAEDRALLPRQILLGRAAAIGAPFAAEIVRGALLIKLAQFLDGACAVTPALCSFLADRLNDGLTPYVPSAGLGMAGEIIPLCHLAQVLTGEGFVLDTAGNPQPADLWYRAQGAAPYEPQPKEGLSLINGTAMAPAVAHHLLRSLDRTLSTADLVAACSIEGLAAPLEPYDPMVGRLRRDPGLDDATARLRDLLRDSEITRQAKQGPVSFRVIPQIHAAARRALDDLAAATAAEMISIGDNPAFIADEADPAKDHLLHCGNFHAAALTQTVEAASLATMQVGLLAERRLHRLLDARLSGLAPQLAKRPGLDAGLITLHKAALGLTAELRSLAIAPSLMHGESSFGQEDAMTMIFPALDRLGRIDRLNRQILGYELYTALVAVDAVTDGRGMRPAPAVAALRDRIRGVIPAYGGDRSYGPEIERLLALLFD